MVQYHHCILNIEAHSHATSTRSVFLFALGVSVLFWGSLGGAQCHRYEGAVPPPLMNACAPNLIYSKYCFWNITLQNNRQRWKQEKRTNNIKMQYFPLTISQLFCEIADSQFLCMNVTQ